MVGLQILDLPIGVRVPASQPIGFRPFKTPRLNSKHVVAIHPYSSLSNVIGRSRRRLPVA